MIAPLHLAIALQVASADVSAVVEQRRIPQAALEAVSRSEIARAIPLVEAELALCVAASAEGVACVQLFSFLSLLQTRAGKAAIAVETAHRAIAAAERASGGTSLYLAACIQAVAPAFQLAGQVSRAEGLMQRAVAIRTERLGPDHLLTLSAELERGSLLTGLGRAKDAELVFRSILARLRANPQSDPRHIAEVQLQIADLIAPWRLEEARALITAVLESLGAKGVPGDPLFLKAEFLFAQIVQRERKYDAARTIYERLLGVAEARGGDASLLLKYLVPLAQIEGYVGNYDRSDAHFARMVTIITTTNAPSLLFIGIVPSHAMRLAERKRYAEAEELLDRAIALAPSSRDADVTYVQILKLVKVQILNEQGKFAEVRRVFDGPMLAFMHRMSNRDGMVILSYGTFGTALMETGADLARARSVLRHAAALAHDHVRSGTDFDAESTRSAQTYTPIFRDQVQAAWRLAQSRP